MAARTFFRRIVGMALIRPVPVLPPTGAGQGPGGTVKPDAARGARKDQLAATIRGLSLARGAAALASMKFSTRGRMFSRQDLPAKMP